MAEMIPEFYDDDTTPPGEKDVFGWLSSCPSDWVVMHSLDLQAWNRNRQTEIDFLVIIPETGILCVEVKSHKSVEVTPQGLWKLNNKPQDRSPLKQADDATKTFHRRLKGQYPNLAGVPVFRLIVFPRAIFSLPKSVEYHSWEIMNQSDCLKHVDAGEFCTKIEQSLVRSIDQHKYAKPLANPLPARSIKELKDFLRPTFKSVPSAKASQERRKAHISNLLRETQKPVVRLFRDNPRLIVDGPAGSGKTLIALELARRSAEQGLRTGLLCYNRLIGKHLASEVESDGPLLLAGTAYAMLRSLLNIEVPENPDQDYWDSEFLDLAENALLSDDRKADCPFDVLVVDEAQDLLSRPRLLGCVESLVRGEFNDGKWALFGDFEHQFFGEDENQSVLSDRLEKLKAIPGAAKYSLGENCRNYGIVVKPCLKLAGMSDVYPDGYRRGDGGQEVYTPVFYQDAASFEKKLQVEIDRYVKEGTRAEDIIVLTCAGFDHGAAKRLCGDGNLLKPYGATGDRASYASVQEFKGLECGVVILTDVAEPTGPSSRNAFYVGMTRATYAVSVMVPQNSHGWFLNATAKL
ncbi:MAG: NERD domain-containing protein [Rubripirellula sp.]